MLYKPSRHEPETRPARRPFLTARWENLAIISYTVPPDLLRPRLPPGLELDTRDGQAFVSLVPFDFFDTRVLGIPWPGYRDFPEINLRFYVRAGQERGIVFIREFVPKRLIAWMAKLCYNEPYSVAHVRERSRVERPACLRGQRQVQGDELGDGVHLVARVEPFDAELAEPFRRNKWVVCDDAHAEPVRAASDLLADATEAEDAQRLARELDAAVRRALPAALLQCGMRLRDVARERDEQADRMLGR